VGEGDAGFGEADEFDGLLGGDGERERFGIGQADVFAGEDDMQRALEAEIVVCLVAADPEPVEFAAPLPGESAIPATDLSGVDAAFSVEA